MYLAVTKNVNKVAMTIATPVHNRIQQKQTDLEQYYYCQSSIKD